MSNMLDPIVKHTPSFQDLINIQVPSYQAGVRPTSYTPTSAGLNPNCVYMTPAVSAGVSNTSGQLGYSVPPWLHGANWSQPYAKIQAHPNNPMLGSPPYLGNAGNGSHQAQRCHDLIFVTTRHCDFGKDQIGLLMIASMDVWEATKIFKLVCIKQCLNPPSLLIC